MSASIATICDPSTGDLTEAIRQAKICAEGGPGFDLDLSRFLQMQCFSNHVHLPAIFRGLEVLESITDESKLLTLLRPFLKSSDPQIASKCVLVLGRRCHNIGWMKNVMAEIDERIRANLVESLWRRNEPEIELVMRSALKDPHHRVAANAVYGLYLLGSPLYAEGLDDLIASENQSRRRSAIWVIRSIGTAEASARIKPLIRDPDPGVRRAAFDALVYLREHGSRPAPQIELALARPA
ncbi:MAG: HEAT repeat domain-containing protein [Acidobacteriota bacterium]|nr:HEAT repeat domain-containing protein [Acidobacteriota bacterium]